MGSQRRAHICAHLADVNTCLEHELHGLYLLPAVECEFGEGLLARTGYRALLQCDHLRTGAAVTARVGGRCVNVGGGWMFLSLSFSASHLLLKFLHDADVDLTRPLSRQVQPPVSG